ncbi:hypothetical protein C7D72_29830, partial [Klebsiella pneumoniae]
TGLNWQEKNLTLTPTSLQGLLLIALPKVAKVAQEQVVEPKIATGLNWQEKNLTLTPTSLQGLLLIALPKVAKVA